MHFLSLPLPTLAGNVANLATAGEKSGEATAWTTEEEQELIERYRRGQDISKIHYAMRKTGESVRQKLEELKNTRRLRIAVENEHYRVELVERRRCDTCPNKFKFIFTIYDKKRDLSEEFVLDDAYGPDEVYNLILRGKRLAIMGRRGDKAIYVVCIIDVEKKELEDTFWAYRLTLSPSKRFLAYVKFFPRHGPSSNVVVIYDLAGSACKNRLPGYCNNETGRASVTDSGLPIYPGGNVEQKSYNQWGTPEHHIVSPLLWSKDEKKVVFFDLHGSQNYMVVVDMHKGIESPMIRLRPLDPKILIKEDLPLEEKKFYREKIDRSPKFPFVVESLWWDETGEQVIVRPNNRINPWIVDELMLLLP